VEKSLESIDCNGPNWCHCFLAPWLGNGHTLLIYDILFQLTRSHGIQCHANRLTAQTEHCIAIV